MRGRSRSGESPVLFFDDVVAAVAFYRDLGFQVDMDGDDAVAIGHGVRIRLREASHNGNARRERRTGAADAVIEVDRPYRLRRQLCEGHNGSGLVDGIDPGKPRFFRIVDPFANVIAVGPKPGPVAASKRAVWAVMDRVRIAGWRVRNELRERPCRREFEAFYSALPDQRDIYYMFFLGEGLLHWVAKAASYVPAEVNLVVIGAAVPEHEQRWVPERLGRPFFHLDLAVDDRTVWKFLLQTNEHNFGWLDVDCLVLNSDLFGELSSVTPDSCVNATWWYDSGFGFPLAATYLQFVNIEAERAMRAAGFHVDPTVYTYVPANLRVPGQHYYTRILPRRFRRQLRQILPADARGRPYYPGPMHPETGDIRYFDTTVVRQLIARTMGFSGHQVRRLARRGLGGTGAGFEEISDEIVHIGGASYNNSAQQLHDNSGTRLRYLLANHVALLGAAGRLPPGYLDRQRSVTEQLARLGFDPESATEAARRHLIDDRGLSEHGAEAVLRPPMPSG